MSASAGTGSASSARDAWKSPDALYRLHWDKSKGFIRLAMRAKAPIILHMGIGIDETTALVIRGSGASIEALREELRLER